MTARELSFSVLKTASKSGTYSNIALDNALKRNELNDADRGLVTAIVMGVTERRLTLDYIIDKLAADPSRIESETRDLLRMGIYQIIFMDKIPEYAAVNETVKLSARYAARTKGLINAILRRTVREKDELPFPSGNSPEALAIRHSIPLWILESWQKDYPDKLEALCDAVNVTAPLTLRVSSA